MKLFELKQIIREEMDNLLSEGLKFHLNNKIRVNENIFRPGSTKYFELFAEVRELSKNGLYKLDENEKDIWEVYTVNKKTMSKCYDLPEGGEYIDYTIRTVSDTARKYKVLNANTYVWIE